MLPNQVIYPIIIYGCMQDTRDDANCYNYTMTYMSNQWASDHIYFIFNPVVEKIKSFDQQSVLYECPKAEFQFFSEWTK